MGQGRLTPQDRQRIAAGLTAGRGYADIARSLGRPTSTVTREVARNGGPAAYRAGDAQRASVRRARQRKGTTARSAPAAADPYGRDPEAVADAIAELTAMLVQTGLPQMAASVFACLYATDAGGLTAAELVRRLRVSPASVSKAVGYLEAQELVRRERDTSGRRERYILCGDLWHRSLLASAQRNTALAEGARRTAVILGSDTPAGARLADAAEFLDRIGQEIIQAVHRWWQARPEGGSAPTVANDPQPGETTKFDQRITPGPGPA